MNPRQPISNIKYSTFQPTRIILKYLSNFSRWQYSIFSSIGTVNSIIIIIFLEGEKIYSSHVDPPYLLEAAVDTCPRNGTVEDQSNRSNLCLHSKHQNPS